MATPSRKDIIFSPAVNVIAIVWVIFITIVFALPPNELVLWTMLLVALLLAAYWQVSARRRFVAPLLPEGDSCGNSRTRPPSATRRGSRGVRKSCVTSPGSWEAEALIKPTGRIYRQDYVVFLRAAGGKIAFLREYFDPVRASQAMGAPILGPES